MIELDRLITANDALGLVVRELLTNCSIQGLRPFNREVLGDSLHIEFKRAWTVSCSLSINFDMGRRTSARGPGRRATQEPVWLKEPRVEVCWSSTGRSVAAAHAALALYREVVELAALIQARLDEETIGFREERTSNDSASTEGASR